MPHVVTEDQNDIYLTIQRVLLESGDTDLRGAAEAAYALMRGAEAYSADHYELDRNGGRVILEWSGAAYSLSWQTCECGKPSGHRYLHREYRNPTWNVGLNWGAGLAEPDDGIDYMAEAMRNESLK